MTKFAPLFDSPWRGVFHTAGGSLLISDLGTTPGASSTLLDASIPYSGYAWRDVLGYMPKGHVSAHGARQLALQALLRARRMLAPEGAQHVFGFGVTAALRTSRSKRGEHRAYVALQTPRKTTVWHIPFAKEALTRQEEERVLADTAYELLLVGLDLDKHASSIQPVGDASCAQEISALFSDTPTVVGQPGKAVMPGAFNPLHDGHRRMQAFASERLGTHVAYELSVRNVDKPHLDCIDIEERFAQFKSDAVVLTNQPRFVEKASLLFKETGGTYVVGADTIKRIDATVYYGSKQNRRDAIKRLTELNVRFLVFGRIDDSKFFALEDLALGSDLRALCHGVTEKEFRVDISSTALRAKQS